MKIPFVTLAISLMAVGLCSCSHRTGAGWRVYVPFATISKKGIEKAGGVQGCMHGIIPVALCND